jgi:hypothetical protein
LADPTQVAAQQAAKVAAAQQQGQMYAAQVLAGNPLYLTSPETYAAIILVLMMFLAVVVMVFAPFMPYAIAWMKRGKLVAMIDRTRQIVLKGADIRNGMYYFNDKPWRFVKQYPGAFFLGKGVMFDLVHIDLAFVQDPYMNAAVLELEEQYGITNYLELQEAIRAEIIDRDDEILVPFFFRIPFDALLNYGAVVPPADITGEVEDLVEDRKSPEFATFKKLMPWVIMLAIVMIVGALAYVMISK